MLSLTRHSPAQPVMCTGRSLLLPGTSVPTTLRRQTSYRRLSCNAISLTASAHSETTTGSSIIGKDTSENFVQKHHHSDELYLKEVGLRPDRLPKHVLMMLDGSRRACEKNGMQLTYEPFYRSFVMFAELCLKLGIPAASFAIFATCTWKRTHVRFFLSFISSVSHQHGTLIMLNEA